MRIMRIVCWLALPASLILGGLNAASAQGSDQAREACTPDAMRLCSEFIPDADRVRSCMLRKRRELSEPCRLAMVGGGKAGHRHYRHRHHAD